MNTLPRLGFPLPRMLVPLRKERDLMYFDGPLISVSRGPTNEPFIEMAVDRDDALERWMIVRTSELNLLKYIHRKVTLLEIVWSTPDGYVVLADYNSNGLAYVALVSLSDIPDEISPREGALHDPSFEPEETKARDKQAIFLDNKWDPAALSTLQRRYSQVYSFLSMVNTNDEDTQKQLERKFGNYKFNGGYVFKTVYDRVEHALLHTKQPKSLDFQVTSPGYLRFKVDPEDAARVRHALASFLHERNKITAIYDTVHRMLIEMRRKVDKHEMTEGQANEAYEGALTKPVKALADALQIPYKALMHVSSTSVAAGHILASYFRKIDELARLDEGGSAEIR
jgi:hypothetical protein